MLVKRILLLSHEMTYTGAPNSLLNVALLLRSKGNYVKVATLKSGEFEKEFSKHGFWVRHFDEEKYEYEKLAKKQDLVIANTIFCGKFALKAQLYVPTILYIREAQNIPELIKNCGLSAEYITKSENVICVSEYAEKFIRENYNPKNLFTLHNFLNKPFYYKPPKNISKDGKVHFLIAGTIENRKSYDIALKAFELLPNDIRQKAVLHIAGKKPEWSREYWENLRFDVPGVVYHGEITSKKEMNRLYDNVNCVIVPSLDEACSLVTLEGAMHGKALILSENVGAKYILNNNGLIFESGNAMSLCLAITDIMSKQNILSEMGIISFTMFCQTSSANIYYKEFKNIIPKSIKRKG